MRTSIPALSVRNLIVAAAAIAVFAVASVLATFGWLTLVGARHAARWMP